MRIRITFFDTLELAQDYFFWIDSMVAHCETNTGRHKGVAPDVSLKAFERAVRLFSSQYTFAEVLHWEQSKVSRVLSGYYQLTYEDACRIEMMTHALITREMLKPEETALNAYFQPQQPKLILQAPIDWLEWEPERELSEKIHVPIRIQQFKHDQLIPAVIVDQHYEVFAGVATVLAAKHFL